MRRVLVLVLAAGCANDTSGPPPDFNGLDLIVGSDGAIGYVDFTNAWITNPHFPRPGTCASAGEDYIAVLTSCFERLVLDGVGFLESGGSRNPFAGPTFTDTATLTITGCGASVDVQLHRAPSPTLADASTVLVTTSQANSSSWCHDDAASAVFDSGTRVLPLAAPEVIETTVGEVRVWYGDEQSVP